MTDELELLTKARDMPWPPMHVPANEIRAAGTRRTTLARAAVAAGAAAIVATGFTLATATRSDDREHVTDDLVASTRTNFAGATMILPNDWRVLDRVDSTHWCVGPAAGIVTDPQTGARQSCPVEIAVAREPSDAVENGLNPVVDLMSICAPSDPREVVVSHESTGGRASSHYVGRCDDTSPAMSVWALDNRTVYVLARDPGDRDNAAGVFASLKTPGSWPGEAQEVVSEAPEAG